MSSTVPTYARARRGIWQAVDKRAVVRAAAVAILAQGITTAVSALTVLLLAGRLDELQYGLWQFFLLIGGYSGLFHLGLCDGVYLCCGGGDYDSLDLSRLGTLFFRMTLWLSGVAAVLGVAASFALNGGRMWAILAALIYMPLFNAHAYLGCLAQATGHCSRYSASVMLDRGCFALGTLASALAGVTDFRAYAAVCIASKLISLILLVITERRVVFAPHCRVSQISNELRPGARLLTANLAAQLSTSAPRFAILWRMGESELGRVSFFITLSGMLTQLASQLAMVLFPALRREDSRSVTQVLGRLGGAVRLALPASLMLIKPLGFFVGLILPRYAADTDLLAILLPMGVLDVHTQLVSLTELKVAHRERRIMVLEAVCGGLGLVLCFTAAALGGSRSAVLLCAALLSGVRCVGAAVCARFSLSPRALSPHERADVIRVAVFSALCLLSAPLNLGLGTWSYALLYLIYLIGCVTHLSRERVSA